MGRDSKAGSGEAHPLLVITRAEISSCFESRPTRGSADAASFFADMYAVTCCTISRYCPARVSVSSWPSKEQASPTHHGGIQKERNSSKEPEVGRDGQGSGLRHEQCRESLTWCRSK